jgi:hypothetical protein
MERLFFYAEVEGIRIALSNIAENSTINLPYLAKVLRPDIKINKRTLLSATKPGEYPGFTYVELLKKWREYYQRHKDEIRRRRYSQRYSAREEIKEFVCRKSNNEPEMDLIEKFDCAIALALKDYLSSKNTGVIKIKSFGRFLRKKHKVNLSSRLLTESLKRIGCYYEGGGRWKM